MRVMCDACCHGRRASPSFCELSCSSARKRSLVAFVDGARFLARRNQRSGRERGRRNPQSTHLEHEVGSLHKTAMIGCLRALDVSCAPGAGGVRCGEHRPDGQRTARAGRERAHPRRSLPPSGVKGARLAALRGICSTPAMSHPCAALLHRTAALGIALAALLAPRQAPARGAPAGGGPAPSARPEAPSLVTEAERTGFRRTGRYAEVERLCRDFAQAYPGRARCDRFGTTPEGRPMLALVASADGTLDPAAARAKRRPVVLFQGGIHAGEIDGKDAGFWLLRELLDGKVAPGALAAVTVVFVPVFNVDGHERFGAEPPAQPARPRGDGLAHHRAEPQPQPRLREGRRARDARRMLRAARRVGPGGLRRPARHRRREVRARRRGARRAARRRAPTGSTPRRARLSRGAAGAPHARSVTCRSPFYPSFREDDDPASGFATGEPPPRFSQAYCAARNRFGVLVETHSWRTYAERVRATHDLLRRCSSASPPARRGAGRAAAERADAASARRRRRRRSPSRTARRPRRAPSTSAATPTSSAPSDDLGRHVDPLRRDEARRSGRCRCSTRSSRTLTVTAPRGGYVVPAALRALVADKLAPARHRVSSGSTRPRPASTVEVFRADRGDVRSRPFEGRTRATLEGAWRAGARSDLPAGALFVPIAQPRARLVAAPARAARRPTRSSPGASSTPSSSRRSTWRPTSPRR